MPSAWKSYSFSCHLEDDKELIEILNEAARRDQRSELVRRALKAYIKKAAKKLDLTPVLEQLDRIEQKIDAGVTVGHPPEEEKTEVREKLDSLFDI